MTDIVTPQGGCSIYDNSSNVEEHAIAHLLAKSQNMEADSSRESALSEDLLVRYGSASRTVCCGEHLRLNQGSSARDEWEPSHEAALNGGPILTAPVPKEPVLAVTPAPHAQTEDMFGDCAIDPDGFHLSPTTFHHKNIGDVTVAADDTRFVDILFQGTRIFTVGKVEILIVRHKRNRLLEMIVCADGARVEVGHFYVRHEDLLSVVSQKDIQSRLRLAVQSWTGDGLPDIRSLLRCATTSAQVDYLLDHLSVSVEESHHGLSNLAAQFIPDVASGKQLPPMVLDHKPAQVPKLRWQPSITSMETIEEGPECRERSLRMKSVPAKETGRLTAGEKMQSKEHTAIACNERLTHEVVRVKPHRHNSMFSYFSPFHSGGTRLRTRSSDARDGEEDEDGDSGAPVSMFQQLLNAMRAHSMRVLPTETDEMPKRAELERQLSASTMSVNFGFGEVSVSSKSAPPALNIPLSG